MSDTHIIAKCVSTFLLFGATVLFGILPLRLARNRAVGSEHTLSEGEILVLEASKRKRRLLLSFCNCFAGGVFFSTCLLDLLPMVRSRMEEAINAVGLASHFPLGEFIASFGFLMMLITEQIVHICSHGSVLLHDAHHDHEDRGSKTPLLTKHEEHAHKSSYGSPDAIHVEASGLPMNHHDDTLASPSVSPSPSNNSFQDIEFQPDYPSAMPRRRSKSLVSVRTITQTNFRTYILVFALSLHSIFEGLSLGLVIGMDTLMQLIVAMAIHKCILAFSLGVKLVDGNLRSVVVVKGVILFAAMAPIGMGLGLAVLSSFSRTINLFFSGILQGIATGTFLYVTFFEVLPHELNLTGPSRFLMVKSLFVVLGFAVIGGICYYENKFHHIKKILPHSH